MDKDTCCPEFHPAPCDDKVFEWKDKRFVKDKAFETPQNLDEVVAFLDKILK